MITSRSDGCNSLLSGLLQSMSIKNCAARELLPTSPHQYITLFGFELHCLCFKPISSLLRGKTLVVSNTVLVVTEHGKKCL